MQIIYKRQNKSCFLGGRAAVVFIRHSLFYSSRHHDGATFASPMDSKAFCACRGRYEHICLRLRTVHNENPNVFPGLLQNKRAPTETQRCGGRSCSERKKTKHIRWFHLSAERKAALSFAKLEEPDDPSYPTDALTHVGRPRRGPETRETPTRRSI